MKTFYLLLVLMTIANLSNAQVAGKGTSNGQSDGDFGIERPPEYPGGVSEFYKYLSNNLKYPTIARLVGINGRLVLSFVVDENGKVTKATPINCIGAGCEAEAVRLLETSPAWKPGINKGQPVSVHYNVPITFSIEGNNQKVLMKELRASGYGFVFSIKDTLYTIDEAENLLGKSFKSTQVQIAEPFYNYNKVAKFDMPDKKETYLIIIKS